MNNKFLEQINSFEDKEIWNLFAYVKNLLKKRGLVRTNNIIGERGEFLAIETYGSIPNLPKLQAAPEGTQNVDALSRNGERYSIKTITLPSTLTGVFYGLGTPENPEVPEKKFEHVIIVVIDKDLQLKNMIELDWILFLKYRKWHKTMQAWNLNLTKSLLHEAKIIFQDKKQDT